LLLDSVPFTSPNAAIVASNVAVVDPIVAPSPLIEAILETIAAFTVIIAALLGHRSRKCETTAEEGATNDEFQETNDEVASANDEVDERNDETVALSSSVLEDTYAVAVFASVSVPGVPGS
jgi:hypothetical protein